MRFCATCPGRCRCQCWRRDRALASAPAAYCAAASRADGLRARYGRATGCRNDRLRARPRIANHSRRGAGSGFGDARCRFAAELSHRPRFVRPAGRRDRVGVRRCRRFRLLQSHGRACSVADVRHLGASASNAYSTDASIVEAELHTYYFDASLRQLRHYDGDRTDVPVVDNVVQLEFEYFGEPSPPTAPKPALGTANCLYDAGGTPAASLAWCRPRAHRWRPCRWRCCPTALGAAEAARCSMPTC